MPPPQVDNDNLKCYAASVNQSASTIIAKQTIILSACEQLLKMTNVTNVKFSNIVSYVKMPTYESIYECMCTHMNEKYSCPGVSKQ
jgi:hypothetical protein